MAHTGLVYFIPDKSGDGYDLWDLDSNDKKHLVFPEEMPRSSWYVEGVDEGLVLLRGCKGMFAVGNPSTNSWHTFEGNKKRYFELAGLRVHLNATGGIESYAVRAYRMEITTGSRDYVSWGYKLPWELQKHMLEGSQVVSSYNSRTKSWEEANAIIFPTDAALLGSARDKSSLRSSWDKWKNRLCLYNLDIKGTCGYEDKFEDPCYHEVVVCQGKILDFYCEGTLVKVKQVELSRGRSELLARPPKGMVIPPSCGFSFSQAVGEFVVLKFESDEDEDEDEDEDAEDMEGKKTSKVDGGAEQMVRNELLVYNAITQKWHQFPCEIDGIGDGAFLLPRPDPLP